MVGSDVIAAVTVGVSPADRTPATSEGFQPNPSRRSRWIASESVSDSRYGARLSVPMNDGSGGETVMVTVSEALSSPSETFTLKVSAVGPATVGAWNGMTAELVCPCDWYCERLMEG